MYSAMYVHGGASVMTIEIAFAAESWPARMSASKERRYHEIAEAFSV